MTIQNRYEFVYLFDVTNGNPTGDPDAGNMPRLDPDSSRGLMTDVSLKRKIRNFISLIEVDEEGKEKPRFKVFIKEKSVLNHQISLAYESDSVKQSLLDWDEYEKDKKDKKKKPEQKKKQPEKHYEDIAQQWMCDNFFDVRMFGAVMSTGSKNDGDTEEDGDEKKSKLIKRAGQVRGPVQLTFAKSVDPIIPLEVSITRMAVTNEKDLEKERTMGRKHIVPYGAVMSTGSKNDGDTEEDGDEKKSKLIKRAGQVRGPVQLTFAKSVDPIIPLEVSITRMAVTNEKDLEKERTMGRKHIVPYGLYRAHGFISAHLAKKTTGFSDEDLSKLWQALEQMFEHDRSAARGEMVGRHLVVFKHATALGNAPSHELFERVVVDRVHGEKGSPAQAFSDYLVKLDGQAIKGFKHVVEVV